MALSVDEANTVSSKYYDKTLRQQVYQDCPFWVKLKQKNRVSADGGTQITWPIRYTALSKADAVGPRQQFVYSSKETRTQAVLEWAYYFVDTMISWDERVKNTGKAQVVKLLGDKAEEAKQDLDDRFATDLFTANPNGNGMADLKTIVDSTTTYAGIAYTDADKWVAGEDSATTELTLYGAAGSLATMVNAATFGKLKPNMHLTTRNLQAKFESLLEPGKRYEDKEMADAGFSNVTFHGAPVFGDPYVTTSYWYGLCMDTFEIAYHPDFDLVVSEWKELTQAGYPNALVKTISWAGNIKCHTRKANFKMTALDYTL